MTGKSRKWMILVAAIWIQAFTGTNFDFSAYSSNLKSILGISQVQLNYLATASDLGKALGWSSGLALMYFPLWVVLFMAAFMGLIGYGLQWLVIQNIIYLPYILVFLLCLLAGLSICWFNTVCFVLCIQNFPANRALALALTISFNGVSPALYTLAAKAISLTNSSVYLILNSLIPIVVALATLIPILRQRPLSQVPTDFRRESLIFIILNAIAVITGLYLLLLNPIATTAFSSRLLFIGAIVLLIVPLCIPGIVVARDWASRAIHKSFHLESSDFKLVDVDDLELHRDLLSGREDCYKNNDVTSNGYTGGHTGKAGEKQRSLDRLIGMHSLLVLGEEHSAASLVQRWDFWFYYLTYLCSGTLGLVYSNNLGQISQSLGDATNTTRLVTLYSTCSFFGRLLAAAPDFLRGKLNFARTGWLMIALTPMPIAFLVLATSHGGIGLHIGTSLIGLSSGFIFAAAVSITSELFGPNSVGVNHNILITNIPLGSLVYGLLSAIVYDANVESAGGGGGLTSIFEAGATGKVCMGRKCYMLTFLCWGFISLFGLVCSSLLFRRTKVAYDRFEENQILT